jgi:hypothetical protein
VALQIGEIVIFTTGRITFLKDSISQATLNLKVNDQNIICNIQDRGGVTNSASISPNYRTANTVNSLVKQISYISQMQNDTKGSTYISMNKEMQDSLLRFTPEHTLHIGLSSAAPRYKRWRQQIDIHKKEHI